MADPPVHACIDCRKDPPARVRPLWSELKPSDPPRCTTHGRAWRTRSRKLAQDRRIEAFGGITPEQYWAQYEAQGRKCWFPRCRATGKVKRLAIDHDHQFAAMWCTHDPRTQACPACFRALLCGPHNYELMGKWRVDLDDAQRLLAMAPGLAAPSAEADLDRV